MVNCRILVFTHIKIYTHTQTERQTHTHTDILVCSTCLILSLFCFICLVLVRAPTYEDSRALSVDWDNLRVTLKMEETKLGSLNCQKFTCEAISHGKVLMPLQSWIFALLLSSGLVFWFWFSLIWIIGFFLAEFRSVFAIVLYWLRPGSFCCFHFLSGLFSLSIYIYV